MKIPKPIRQTFEKQQDAADCGIACLRSVIAYYGAKVSTEQLRSLAGTSYSGTTLLGLLEAARSIGFEADGGEATTDWLFEQKHPVILLITKAGLNHFVVCYNSIANTSGINYLIGDPATGLTWIKSSELENIWSNGVCLDLIPSKNFQTAAELSQKKWDWFKELLKPEFPMLAISITIGVLTTILGLSMTVFSQKMIDEILPDRNSNKLLIGLASLLFLLTTKETLSYIRQKILLKQGSKLNSRMSNQFFQKLIKLPLQFFQSRKIGDLTSRLHDTSRIQQVITQLSNNLVNDLLITIFSVLFVFYYSFGAGLLTFVAIPLLFFLIQSKKKILIKNQQEVFSSYALVEHNYISTLQGLETIKGRQKESLFTALTKQFYSNYQHTYLKQGKVQIELALHANMLSIIFLFAVLSFSSFAFWKGQLTMGHFIAIVSIFSTLLTSTANLSLLLIPITEAKIAFDRMFEFTSLRAEENQQASISDLTITKLSVKDISFRFPGRTELLSTLSFQLSTSEIVAIMGPNGSGKTTLVHLLERNFNLSSGRITINDNIHIESISLTQWRKLVAVIPQQVHLFNATVLENICFDDAATKLESVKAFLNEFGFTDWINKLPQGLYTLIGTEGQQLSGGQQQLIAIARALYAKPQLLILDEATSAMDRNMELFVLNVLQQQRRTMGILFITHRLHVLRHFCDRIYILEAGQLHASGNHAELITGNNLYSQYWNDLVS